MDNLLAYKKLLSINAFREAPIFNYIQDKNIIFKLKEEQELYFSYDKGLYRARIHGADEELLLSSIIVID